MYRIKPRNFRLRTRIYPYRQEPILDILEDEIIDSQVSNIEQDLNNFGTQEGVEQEAIVNQISSNRIERGWLVWIKNYLLSRRVLI